MPGVEVTTAGPGQWRVVRDLRLASLLDAPEAFCATHDDEAALDERAWRDRLDHPLVCTLLGWLPDEPVGILVVEPWDGGVVAGLASVWVAPRGRGRGVGDALIEAALAHARRWGYQRVALEVGDHNVPARRLYARHGFTRTGRTSTMPPPKSHVTEHELARDL